MPGPRALPGHCCTRGSAALGNTQRPRCSRGCCREEGLSLVSPTWFSTQICHPEEWVGVSRRTEHPPEHQRAHGPRQCWGALHFPHFHLPPCQDRFLPPAAGFGMRNPAWWHVGDIPVPAARRHCPLLHWGFGAAGSGFSSTCWVLSGDISVTQKSLSHEARARGSSSARSGASSGTAASQAGPTLTPSRN